MDNKQNKCQTENKEKCGEKDGEFAEKDRQAMKQKDEGQQTAEKDQQKPNKKHSDDEGDDGSSCSN